jgi:SAM-dependent methyltransferase
MICKITKKKIRKIMSFGEMPLANGFLKKNDFKNEFFYNMEIGWSDELSLLQLNEFPKPEIMFNKNYPFFTSSSKFMIDHFKEYSKWIKNKYFKKKIKVIEIGSNDGTMLSNFKHFGDEYIGFEPSLSVAIEAKKKKINTTNQFFNKKNITKFKNFIKKTDVICAANVICHIPNLSDLIEGVNIALSSNGIFVFEEPYLGSMFEKVSYDQIYDEHIYIFSVTSVEKVFSLYDLELIDAIPQVTHGGSMRYVVARKGKYNKSKRLQKLKDREKKNNLDNYKSCINFKKKCQQSRKNLIDLILKIKDRDLKICGYGATSKSTTILNYCGIGKNFIDCIYDTTKEKINTFSPGMHIPIKSMSDLKNNYPDILYLFAWNHKTEIFRKEKNFIKNGGKWISHVRL